MTIRTAIQQNNPYYERLAWWPAIWVVCGVALAISSPWPLAVFWFVLLPPLLCRLSRVRLTPGQFSMSSATTKRWWWHYQLQLPFNRFSSFEEALRLVPGLYSLWIAAWGGKVSPWAHIAAGVRIVDRQWVHIDAYSVLGIDSMISGHLLERDEQGAWRITLAPVHIESNSIVGAASRLSPGVVVEAGSVIPATVSLPPFNRWRRDKRIKPTFVSRKISQPESEQHG